MEQLTFSQHIAANGGSLPWQDAVRLTLLTIQTISAQADPETTYMDVCPEQIVLSKDAREVLSCGKPHSLKEWDAADAANPQLLPWEFWNAWSARTPAAQVYPVAACLFGALSGKKVSPNRDVPFWAIIYLSKNNLIFVIILL